MPDSLRAGATPPQPAPPSLWRAIDAGAAELHPSYFALVMATGIVSLACQLSALHRLAGALFYLNLLFYGALWGLLLLRLARHFPRLSLFENTGAIFTNETHEMEAEHELA